MKRARRAGKTFSGDDKKSDNDDDADIFMYRIGLTFASVTAPGIFDGAVAGSLQTQTHRIIARWGGCVVCCKTCVPFVEDREQEAGGGGLRRHIHSPNTQTSKYTVTHSHPDPGAKHTYHICTYRRARVTDLL